MTQKKELKLATLDTPIMAQNGIRYTHRVVPEGDWSEDRILGAIRRILESYCGEGNVGTVPMGVGGRRCILVADKAVHCHNHLMKPNGESISHRELHFIWEDIMRCVKAAQEHPELTAQELFDRKAIGDLDVRIVETPKDLKKTRDESTRSGPDSTVNLS